jgi:inorganic pyrophosphatase/exopolyphosphatase
MELYSLEQAREEEEKMRKKIKSGEARSYAEADSQIEREKKKKSETKDFFYSEELDSYVATQPLKVDERVVKAAFDCGIDLSWDDEGRIKDISFVEAKKIAKKIGAILLTPAEYWIAYNEALGKGAEDVVDQLQSDRCTEWLDAVYEKDDQGNVWMIEHPEIVEIGGKIEYKGERKKIEVPEGRPGWFNPEENINKSTGLPVKVETKRKKGSKAWSSTNWKYWSVFKFNEPVSPIRGYVTSSGTPSLDLDIPVGAKQPVLMMRECRKELVEPPLDPELLKKADHFIDQYLLTTVNQPAMQNPKEHDFFYNNRSELLNFLKTSGPEFMKTREKSVLKIKEKMIDMLGVVRVMAKTRGENDVVRDIDDVSQFLFGVKKEEVNFQSFSEFMKQGASKLRGALEEKKKIVFVMGHKNPDTDTAVSCIAEAYRNSLLDKDAVYIPVVQGSRIPDEIRKLLGDEISGSVLLTDNPDYEVALRSGQARWILVDQNISEVQRFAVSIIDHHILSEKAKNQDIPKTWEMAGSTAALVAQKFQGMGVELDKDLARIIYGATLMDTENRGEKKMTYKDKLIMDDLKQISGIEDDKKFFQDLMSHLLNTDDAELLFNRDYKQDWGIFGYAVAKIKGGFGPQDEVLKGDLLNKLAELADQNNKKKNFPLTIVKVADYLDDNETINRERIYLIFNDYVLPEFKKTLSEFISRIIQNEFKGKAQVATTENSVDFWGVGDQLSRKVTAPFFEPIVEAFNEYYYSPAIGMYVKREFMQSDEKVQRVAQELGIELSIDRNGRINNITYNEASQLLSHLGQSMMSLSEYWKVLKEAEEGHDEQMLSHLRSPGFVEMLDTVILDKKQIIDHPKVRKDGESFAHDGEKRDIEILEGVPGLISPADIDIETGFPKIIQDPRQYADKSLWRYWSPDGPLCVATRGHIFLLDQSAFDTKIHPDDALPNLGVRACSRTVNPPQVEIIEDENGVSVKITKI